MPEISTDGITVWVNSEFACLGRFGRWGIDIHTGDPTSPTECLFCTHTQTTLLDWELFRTRMMELHQVEVPPDYCPERFRKMSEA